ncbi:M61 family metallopeptidase [Mangrovimonas aestuarii]|uniref:M61 family metallopeptidase n=1 Tax=Mangrovimonas aestuarii TaxID=3018443 RepID=UPI002379570A|nr:peptidase M61 [Mangrovimonas aestuarii]
MKRILITGVLAAMILSSCGSSKISDSELATNTPISASIDLTKVKNDQVPVTINPGRFTQDQVTYRLPKVVQGTYSVSDFGSFVGGFEAFDYKGNTMAVNKTDKNTWVIENAKDLDKIIYWVNDTYDIEQAGKQPTPFSPSGTNIQPDNYVLNLHGFVGYFDSLKNNQYKLDVTADANFNRTSALPVTNTTVSQDGSAKTSSYFASRYFEITDNPMMYGTLDVEEFKVGDINIVLSVFSPNKVHSAAKIKETMYKMMKAQKTFLGEINSTKRYDIYLYLSEEGADEPTGFGALEHHTSTVVVLPESMSDEALAESMIDVVSHEFFHIVTPLSVHSEDVHYFDYNDPTFSKHLWMYEGVTEYFATLFQVNQALVSNQDFYDKIMGKIQTAARMDDTMSFTVMSENILEEPYASNYYNVYQKGALIGMCIDIILREESNGQRGILWLMKELSKKYGKDHPFNDDAIMDEIASMTYPSIREFFDIHVIGTTPIDYNKYFKKVGLMVKEGKVETNYIQGNGALVVGVNPENGTVIFNDSVLNNSFWKEAGAMPNDVIKEINGQAVTLQTANQIFQGVFAWEPGKHVKVVLDRNGEVVMIDTDLTTAYSQGEKLQENPEATPEQLALRKVWIKG